MRFRYNSPIVLSYALVAAAVLGLDVSLGTQLIPNFFVVYPVFDGTDLLSYVRLVSHVVGHADFTHLVSNFALILLIGPILEEKYGSASLLFMMLVTALATGVLNVVFLDAGLMGASGIVFMMILLSSFTNIRSGEIPLTFVLVVLIYVVREIVNAFGNDNVSQLAHIVGGVFGSLFGFAIARPGRPPQPAAED